MLRTRVCLVAALLVAATLSTVSAQTAAPAAAPAAATTPAAPKPSRIKLTVERLRELHAKWVRNRPKLKACRKEVKSKGLTGADRWFYMEDCMDKT